MVRLRQNVHLRRDPDQDKMRAQDIHPFHQTEYYHHGLLMQMKFEYLHFYNFEDPENVI